MEKKYVFDLIDSISSKEDFMKFVEALYRDFQENQHDWENRGIDQYLESIVAWMEDTNEDLSKPDWKMFAILLYVGKIYE